MGKHTRIGLIIVVLLACACGGGDGGTQAPTEASEIAALEPTAVPVSPIPPTETAAPEPSPTDIPPTATSTAAPTVAPPTPTPLPPAEPTVTATPDVPFEEVTLTTEDGMNLAATLFGDGKVAVLLLHHGIGNADEKSWHSFARSAAERGFAVLTLSYRGRGKSGGDPDRGNLLTDARAAATFLQERGFGRLVCMGAGVWGATPCIQLASEVGLDGLVVLSSSLTPSPDSEVTDEDLKELTAASLYVYGERDHEGIPEAMTEMYRLSPEPKEIVTFDTTARGTELLRSAYADDMRELLLGFLAELPPAVEATSKPPSTSDTAPTSPSLGDTWIRPTDGMVMLYVPGGTFQMGSSEAEIEAQLSECEGITTYCNHKFYKDETPQHPVTVDGYWLDQTEVTNAQFAAFLNEHGNRAENGGQCAELNEGYIRIKEVNGEYVPMTGAGDHPVLMISWVGADAYCRWAGGRLPTEAEWEYAARGKEGNIYPWGDERPNCDLANSGACAGTTLPAAGMPDGSSWCGAMGMAGNAWEWTSDLFGPYSSIPQVNPTGSTTGGMHVLRGGGWHANDWMARSAYRLHDTGSSSHVGCIGLRCALTPQE